MERKYYLRGLGIGIAVTAIIMGIALSGDKAMTDDEIIARARELGMVENTVLTDIDDETGGEENADAQDETGGIEGAAQSKQENPESKAPAADEKDQEEETAANGEEGENSMTAPEAGETDTAGDGQGAVDAGNEPDVTVPVREEEQDTPVGKADVETDNAASEEQAANRPEDNGSTGNTSAAVKTITINHGDGSYTVARKLADVGVVMSADTFDSFLCQNGYDKRLRTGTFSIPADASDEQIARIVTGAE